MGLRKKDFRFLRSFLWLALSAFFALQESMSHPCLAAAPQLPCPILFVTQVPNPNDFTTIASVFGNHRGAIDSAPRGPAQPPTRRPWQHRAP